MKFNTSWHKVQGWQTCRSLEYNKYVWRSHVGSDVIRSIPVETNTVKDTEWYKF